MRSYKRVKIEGGCYFFTLTLANRQGNDLLIRHVDELREAFRLTQRDHPFKMDAVVIMPDHLHCLWQLPPGDDDFSTRWYLIKSRFSRSIKPGEFISKSRLGKGERGLWQRRYWEHLIRDENDYYRHADYIHYNPVKHGYVQAVKDWQYSSFHRWVARGLYPLDWMTAAPEVIDANWE
jgi:putative transposase